MIRPLEQFLLPINSVFLPTFSRLQSQPARYRSTFMRVYEAVALVSFFFTSMLLALSHPVTLVLLGQKWERASAIFAGFAVSGSRFLSQRNKLATHQPGPRKRYFRSEFDCSVPFAGFVRCRSAVWNCRRSNSVFAFRTFAATADSLLQCWTRRTSQHEGFVGWIFVALAVVAGCICRNFVCASMGGRDTPVDAARNMPANRRGCRYCVYLIFEAAATRCQRPMADCQ